MKKSDLIEKRARLKGIHLKDSELAVSVAIDSMTKALVQGDRIEIRGLGSFRLKDYDQYTGHNPKTGEPIIVAAKRLPLFRERRLRKG